MEMTKLEAETLLNFAGRLSRWSGFAALDEANALAAAASRAEAETKGEVAAAEELLEERQNELERVHSDFVGGKGQEC